jgi:hypothetical protein
MTDTNTMKKFEGLKPWKTIGAQCRAEGLTVDTSAYRQGSDYVFIGAPGRGHVYLNRVSGAFDGMTPGGIKFFSSSTEYEAQPWFQALLAFFYVEKAPAVEDGDQEAWRHVKRVATQHSTPR